jgi:erythromycin esterase
MGFDVLVWESGLYDVRLTEEALRGAGENPEAAARRGIFSIWSASAEVEPLFEYVKAREGSMRPMEMAGFDLQFTSDISFNRFAEDLRLLVHALPDAKLRVTASELADHAIVAYKAIRGRIETRSRGKEDPEDAPRFRKDVSDLLEAADRLLALMRAQRPQFLQLRGERQVEFIERVITNMRTEGMDLFDVMGPDRPGGSSPFAPRLEVENRRDALNASNLRWLIQEVYAGKKVIVWAHNAHVMNAYYLSDWRTLATDARSDSMKPMGVFLAEWLQEQVYTIVMTTYGGADGWSTNPAATTRVPAAPQGSLEARIHRLGKQYAFLDLRSLRAIPDHPVHSAQPLRLPKYDVNILPDLPKVADGIFYIDQMTPATGQH